MIFTVRVTVVVMCLHLVLLKCLFRLQCISLFKKLKKITFFYYLTCFPENFTIKYFFLFLGFCFIRYLLTDVIYLHTKKIHVIKTQTKPLNHYQINKRNKSSWMLIPNKLAQKRRFFFIPVFVYMSLYSKTYDVIKLQH